MSQPLKKFWSALERFRGWEAVMDEWYRALEDEYDRVGRFFRPTQQLAMSVRSRVPWRMCDHEIRLFKGEYLEVCTENECDPATRTREGLSLKTPPRFDTLQGDDNDPHPQRCVPRESHDRR